MIDEHTGEIVQASAIAPKDHYRIATDVAGLCGEIVKRTAKVIQRRKYVCVEGWQAITAAHGCVLSIESVSETEAGDVNAIAGIRRMSDGVLIGKAEGFVGMDENTWKGRQRYARRAMAQTRAMSRAARSAFAHVVVLIDSGLSTTPAEEVPDGGFEDGDDAPRHRPAARHIEPEPEEQRPHDPLEDDTEFAARIDAALEGRGFPADMKQQTINFILGRCNAASLEALSLSHRRAAVDKITKGGFDHLNIKKGSEISAPAGKA